MPTPATKQHVRDERDLEHADCGGAVRIYCYTFECHRCRRSWARARVLGWSEAMVASTFYVRPLVENAVVLVWKEDGRKRFVAGVPAVESTRYERVKL